MKDATVERHASQSTGNALGKRVLNETNTLLLDMGLGKDHRRLFCNVKDLTASISSMSVAVYEKLFQTRLDSICRYPTTMIQYIDNVDSILEALRGVILIREAASASYLDKINGTDICSGDVRSIGKLIAVFREIYETLYFNTSLNIVFTEDPDVSEPPQRAHCPRSKKNCNRKGRNCGVIALKQKNCSRKIRTKRGGMLASTRVVPDTYNENADADSVPEARYDSDLHRSQISPMPLNSSISDLSFKKFRERQAGVSFGSFSPVEINQSPHSLVCESIEMEANENILREKPIHDDQNLDAKHEIIDSATDINKQKEEDDARGTRKVSPNLSSKKDKSSRTPLYPLVPMRLSATTCRAEKKYSLLIQDHVETLRLQEKRHRELLARRFRVSKHQQQIDAIRHRNFQQTLCQERLAAQMQQKTTLESHMRIMMNNVLTIEKEKLKIKQKDFSEQIKSIQSSHQRQERALETFFDHQLALLKEELLRNTVEQDLTEKAHRLASKQLLRDLRHDQDENLKCTIDKAQERQKHRLYTWERDHQRQITQMTQKEPTRTIDPFHAAAIRARELRQAKHQTHKRSISKHNTVADD